MNKFAIVLGHTYFSRLKAKSFIISTVIILFFITIVANLETIINLFASDDEEIIIVIDETEEIFPLLEQAVHGTDEDFTLMLFTENEASGKAAVQDGKYEGLLTIRYDEAQYPDATYYENSAIESWAQMMLEQQLQQIKTTLATERAGIDDATLQAIYEPIGFEKIALDET